jgi:sugar/nucleoside kinase (ribokinase family)
VVASEATDPGRPLLCIGEALVDLICPDPVTDGASASRFEAHFGGALANVAVAAARTGAPVALAGGCGDDEWGRFLRERLRSEGVSLDFHTVVPDCRTPFAFATLDTRREPSFRIHGDGIEAGIETLRGREAELAGSAGAIAIGSNTLPDEGSRAITLEVCRAARDDGVPVLFDPNLRRGRWPDLDLARELCLEIAGHAALLKCNAGEARWLAGEEGAPEDLAEALLELGPRLVVITAGPDAAIARGACRATAAPPDVAMVSPLGGGDVLMGTLAGGLHAQGWSLEEAGPALERAVDAAAEACSRLGAFD